MKRKMVILLISVILLSAIYYYISLPDYVVVNSISFSSKNTRDTEIKVVIYKYHDIDNTVKAIEQEHNRINGTPTSLEIANYVQTECQFRYCGTAIPFLTVRSTAR